MPSANNAKQRNKPTADGAVWMRPSQVEVVFGISRALCYLYKTRGWINMVSLRPPGTRRGVALVEVESVRRLIEKAAKPLTVIPGGAE